MTHISPSHCFFTVPTHLLLMTLTGPLTIHQKPIGHSPPSTDTQSTPTITSIAMQSPPDVSAADALLSLSCRHNNLADSSSKIDLPSVVRIYQQRDRRRVLKILSEGILPSIKWGVVKSDFQLSLSQFFTAHSKFLLFLFLPSVMSP